SGHAGRRHGTHTPNRSCGRGGAVPRLCYAAAFRSGGTITSAASSSAGGAFDSAAFVVVAWGTVSLTAVAAAADMSASTAITSETNPTKTSGARAAGPHSQRSRSDSKFSGTVSEPAASQCALTGFTM